MTVDWPGVKVEWTFKVDEEITRGLRRACYEMQALLDGETAKQASVTADAMMLCEEIIES